MRKKSIAVAALSTALGIAVVEASNAWSSFFVPGAAKTRAPASVPPGYVASVVERVIGTDHGPVVLVRPGGENRALPIWVGDAEGKAIARARRGVETPRPMTHDLFATSLEQVGAELHHVRVDHLRPDGIYVGSVVIETPAEGARVIDARPSDAIALALHVGAPIFLAEGLGVHMLTLDPSGP